MIQHKAIELFRERKTHAPFEANAVRFIKPDEYRLLFTFDNKLRYVTLTNKRNMWNLLDIGVEHIMGLPVIGWLSECLKADDVTAGQAVESLTFLRKVKNRNLKVFNLVYCAGHAACRC